MKQENQNKKVLDHLYQSSTMGVDSINMLLPKANDVNMKRELAKQMNTYHDFAKRSSDLIYSINSQPDDGGIAKRLPVASSIMFNTLVDPRETHIAEMMINGYSMGIIDTTRMLNNNPQITQEISNLGKEIVSFEQSGIETMKSFL